MKRKKTGKIKTKINARKILQALVLTVFLIEIFSIGNAIYRKMEKPTIAKEQKGQFYGYSGRADISQGVALSACAESSPTPTSASTNMANPALESTRTRSSETANSNLPSGADALSTPESSSGLPDAESSSCECSLVFGGGDPCTGGTCDGCHCNYSNGGSGATGSQPSSNSPNLSITGSCINNNITLNWTGGPTTDFYKLRIDDKSNNTQSGLEYGWYLANSKDLIADNVTGESYTYQGTSGHTYDIWIHPGASETVAHLDGVTCGSGTIQPNPPDPSEIPTGNTCLMPIPQGSPSRPMVLRNSASITCPEDETAVPASTYWSYVGTTVSSCTSTKKCEFYTPPTTTPPTDPTDPTNPTPTISCDPIVCTDGSDPITTGLDSTSGCPTYTCQPPLPTGPDCAQKVCLGNSCWNGSAYVAGTKTENCATGSAQANPTLIATPGATYLQWTSQKASRMEQACLSGPVIIQRGNSYLSDTKCKEAKQLEACTDKGFQLDFEAQDIGTEICTFYPTNKSDNLPGTPFFVRIEAKSAGICGNNVLDKTEECDYDPSTGIINYIPCPQGKLCQNCTCITDTTKIDGICGKANSKGTTEAPQTDLCLSGTASTVSGSGPWNWTCLGANGGVTANCTAGKVEPNNQGDNNGTDSDCQPDDPSCAKSTCKDVSCFDGCNYQKGIKDCVGRR